MSNELENEIREPSTIEWLYDIAAKSKGMRVEACKKWEDAVREIEQVQVDGPTAEATGNIQDRMAKGEKLFWGNERKMDKLENTQLEELDEGITQGDMSKDKRMADAWSETEQLMRNIRKSNGGDEQSENVRSSIVKEYKTADDGKERLNDVANNPEKQDVSDSQADTSISAYAGIQGAVALGGVDKPVLDDKNEDELVEQMQSATSMTENSYFNDGTVRDTDFILQNGVNPRNARKLTGEAASSIGGRVQSDAEDLNPDKAKDEEVKESLRKHGLDKEELEKHSNGEVLVRVLKSQR